MLFIYEFLLLIAVIFFSLEEKHVYCCQMQIFLLSLYLFGN